MDCGSVAIAPVEEQLLLCTMRKEPGDGASSVLLVPLLSSGVAVDFMGGQGRTSGLLLADPGRRREKGTHTGDIDVVEHLETKKYTGVQRREEDNTIYVRRDQGYNPQLVFDWMRSP